MGDPGVQRGDNLQLMREKGCGERDNRYKVTLRTKWEKNQFYTK